MRDSMGLVLMLFSAAACLYMFFLDFAEANRLGAREKANPNLYRINVLKGFFIGLLGQLPTWGLTFVFYLVKVPFFTFFSYFSDEFKPYIINLGQLQYTWIMKLMNFSWQSYAMAFTLVPLVCLLGYFLGIMGFYLEDKIGPINK